MRSDLRDLESAWVEFLDTPFPEAPEPGYPELADCHADLAEYDGFTAGLLLRLVEGARYIPYPLEPDPQLRARLEEIVASASGEARTDAEGYLAYLRRLERVVEMAARLDVTVAKPRYRTTRQTKR